MRCCMRERTASLLPVFTASIRRLSSTAARAEADMKKAAHPIKKTLTVLCIIVLHRCWPVRRCSPKVRVCRYCLRNFPNGFQDYPIPSGKDSPLGYATESRSEEHT